MDELNIEIVTLSELQRRHEDRLRKREELAARPTPWTPTVDELRILEPGLETLELMAQQIGAHATDEDDLLFMWYGRDSHPGLKPMLMCLVGYSREDGPDILKSCAAYSVAYDWVLDALYKSYDNSRG